MFRINFLNNFGCPFSIIIFDNFPKEKILNGKMVVSIDILAPHRAEIGLAEGGAHGVVHLAARVRGGRPPRQNFPEPTAQLWLGYCTSTRLVTDHPQRPGLCSLDWVSEVVAHTPPQGVGVGGGGAATSRQKGGGGGWGAPSWAPGLGRAEESGEKISPAAAENLRRLR